MSAPLGYQRSRARKLWVPYSGWEWPPPRLRQLVAIVHCAVRGHAWSQWRIETEDWFQYVDGPVPWAWHTCQRCGLLKHAPRDA